MSLNGPILIVDDDLDDQELTISAIKQLNIPNEIRTFQNGQEILEYLNTTEEAPYIILCDVKMPIMNGLELRKIIDTDPYLRRKSIPFVFLTTLVSQPVINDAYLMTVQGFFEKGHTYDDLVKVMEHIFGYWASCLHPNKV